VAALDSTQGSCASFLSHLIPYFLFEFSSFHLCPSLAPPLWASFVARRRKFFSFLFAPSVFESCLYCVLFGVALLFVPLVFSDLTHPPVIRHVSP